MTFVYYDSLTSPALQCHIASTASSMNAAYNHGSQGDLTASRLDSADGDRAPGRSFAPAGTGDVIRAAALEGDIVKLSGLMVSA